MRNRFISRPALIQPPRLAHRRALSMLPRLPDAGERSACRGRRAMAVPAAREMHGTGRSARKAEISRHACY